MTKTKQQKSTTNSESITIAEPKKIINYKIKKTLDLEFYYKSSKSLNIEKIVDEKIEFGFSFKEEINPNENEYKIIVVVEFNHPNIQEERIVFCRIVTEMVFEISNLIEIIKFENGINFSMPQNIKLSLVGLAISTVRGLLISKLSNTEIPWLILPAISVNQIERVIFLNNKITTVK